MDHLLKLFLSVSQFDKLKFDLRGSTVILGELSGENNMDIHDTKCRYRDHVSLNNTKFKLSLFLPV